MFKRVSKYIVPIAALVLLGAVTVYAVGLTLLKTNQTLCYDASGMPTTCGTGIGLGQDGDLKKGVVRSYTDLGDGTIADIATGLVWQKCSDGLSGTNCTTGSAVTVTWANALTYCNANTAGLPGTGWRLPNVYELYSIVDFGVSSGVVINVTYFPATQNVYWSSTAPGGGVSNSAMSFDFNIGAGGGGTTKSSINRVRCVRG